MQKTEVVHFPRLDTVLLVEEAIRKVPSEMTRTALYRALGGRVMYQTLKVILDYLEQSNKITFAGDRIVWVFSNRKLEKAVSRGRKY
ncbi:hypothetical protein HZC09_02440 [Candidatus Micrarchaeota archaeon]|nr:hypothetical protein [Candidatus Micrarchaeota archaeon]